MNTFRVYKPNKQGTGTASQWQLSYQSDDRYHPWKLFYKIATQMGADENGNARFDWDNSIKVKMDISDLGEILAVLEHQQQQVGQDGKIFHKIGPNTKVINFFHNEANNNYFMKVSGKSPKGAVAYQQNMTIGEGCALRILLKEAVIKLSYWGIRGMQKSYSNTTLPASSPNPQNAFSQAI